MRVETFGTANVFEKTKVGNGDDSTSGSSLLARSLSKVDIPAQSGEGLPVFERQKMPRIGHIEQRLSS